jgi:ABC-type amino acid transport substrate-binding protein
VAGELAGFDIDYASGHLGGGVRLYRYLTQADALADLVLGRLDLVLGDHISLEQNFLNSATGGGFAFVGPPLSDSRWFGQGMGVGLAKGDRALRKRLDRAIEKLNENGVFERFQRHWFGYDVRNLSEVLQGQTRSSAR